MLSKFACFSVPLPEVIQETKDLRWGKCRHILQIQQWKATKVKTIPAIGLFGWRRRAAAKTLAVRVLIKFSARSV